MDSNKIKEQYKEALIDWKTKHFLGCIAVRYTDA